MPLQDDNLEDEEMKTTCNPPVWEKKIYLLGVKIRDLFLERRYWRKETIRTTPKNVRRSREGGEARTTRRGVRVPARNRTSCVSFSQCRRLRVGA